MSSTGRGGTRSETDYYPTPAWCVERLFRYIRLPGGLWLEPGAGDGSIIRAANAIRSDVSWIASELRHECLGDLERSTQGGKVRIGNFLGQEKIDLCGSELAIDVAIGNPPFRHALAFVQHALTMADHVVMLLSLNFLGSRARADFMRDTGPDVYILPERPSFVGDGDTDSVVYAWFHWSNIALGGGGGAWRMLDCTPASIRTAAYADKSEVDPRQIDMFAQK